MTRPAVSGMIFLLLARGCFAGGEAVHERGPVFGVTQDSFHMGEEAQKIGQVMQEFSRRMIAALREQSKIDDEEAYARYNETISQGLDCVAALDPFKPGTMQQARDVIESLLLQKQAFNAFEDYDLFSSYMKVLGDDINDIGQKLIEHGIKLCGNFVVEDGLSDFEKKNFEHCANVFRLSSMMNWMEQ